MPICFSFPTNWEQHGKSYNGSPLDAFWQQETSVSSPEDVPLVTPEQSGGRTFSLRGATYTFSKEHITLIADQDSYHDRTRRALPNAVELA